MSINNKNLNHKTLLNLISRALLVTDQNFDLLYQNALASQVLGLDRENFANTSLSELFSLPDDFSKLLEGLSPYEDLKELEAFYHHSETEWSPMLLYFRKIPIQSEDEMGFYIEIETEVKTEFSEDHLKTLGHKTGRIAHGVSNSLAILKLQCDACTLSVQKNRPLSTEKWMEKIGKMAGAVDRLNGGIEELKEVVQALCEPTPEAIGFLFDESEDKKKKS